MTVDFAGVECLSAFDIVPAGAPVQGLDDEGGAARAAIRRIDLRDVLYLPNILEAGQSLCLADRRIVPLESVLDCWSVGFFKEARQTHAGFQTIYADDFDAAAVDEPVCILGNLFSRNFGHWTEELLKVAVLEAAGTECRYVIPTLPSFARESLVFLGVDESRILIVDRPTTFARAIFTTAVSHDTVTDFPAALFRLRKAVTARLGDTASRYGPRLWLERGEMCRAGGVTINREEVYRCLESFDFEVVDMATLPFAEQLRTASGATTIAGPHGSQFVHAQFMPSSSTVIECFSPIYVNPSILQICRVLKHSYHQIVARSHLIAPYAYGRDCHVDCQHLSLILDSL